MANPHKVRFCFAPGCNVELTGTRRHKWCIDHVPYIVTRKNKNCLYCGEKLKTEYKFCKACGPKIWGDKRKMLKDAYNDMSDEEQKKVLLDFAQDIMNGKVKL